MFGLSESNTDIRSASNLSYDPANQTPLRCHSRDELRRRQGSSTIQVPTFHLLDGQNSKSTTQTPSATPEMILQRTKTRPFSWLSFSRRKGSHRTTEPRFSHLPIHSSTSSLSKGSIGKPVLTSTTNATVADVEDVEHSDVLLPDYSHKRMHSSHLRDSWNESSGTAPIGTSSSTSLSWTATVKSVRKKLSHTRRASTSLLREVSWLNLGHDKKGLREKVGAKATNASRVRVIESKKYSLDSYSQHLAASNRHNGERSTSVGNRIDKYAAMGNGKVSNKMRQEAFLPNIACDSATDLQTVSFSKSFANAVDMLDFQSSPTLVYDGTPISKLQKARSYLSLRKFSRDNSDCSLGMSTSNPILTLTRH